MAVGRLTCTAVRWVRCHALTPSESTLVTRIAVDSRRKGSAPPGPSLSLGQVPFMMRRTHAAHSRYRPFTACAVVILDVRSDDPEVLTRARAGRRRTRHCGDDSIPSAHKDRVWPPSRSACQREDAEALRGARLLVEAEETPQYPSAQESCGPHAK